MKKISPVGWFIDKSTADYYIVMMGKMEKYSASKMSQFKSMVRSKFEDKMFKNFTDNGKYYITKEDLDKIFEVVTKK